MTNAPPMTKENRIAACVVATAPRSNRDDTSGEILRAVPFVIGGHSSFSNVHVPHHYAAVVAAGGGLRAVRREAHAPQLPDLPRERERDLPCRCVEEGDLIPARCR